MRDAEKTIGAIADKQSISFIGSIDAEGFPNIKAMLQPRKREGIQTFYFSTNTSSRRVAQYLKDNHACIYFCDRRFFRGVMLRGTMEVLTDNASKEMIWQDGDTMYYPEGVTDPDYCVLRFTAISGRYYSNFKSEDFIIPDCRNR
ncbi:pyridoxamine 5'-phosphate oxidase family protein [uncultured Parabacteroides sp.]|uniref:pyridoxamine 5'-phosphate oxidase family protein n=1 Tax=uncultured Parabacteroides sp. TaxID=512312 RepID=UPI0025D540F1|nr:pyridoxamine 5'-phosphate oxidase family protein [uncultured Parabacteroides sp.]